jgi:hypothetical protein
MGWRSVANLSFLFRVAVCRTRSGVWGHAFPVLRAARALLSRVALCAGPLLHRLRRCPAMFVGFIANYARA